MVQRLVDFSETSSGDGGIRNLVIFFEFYLNRYVRTNIGKDAESPHRRLGPMCTSNFRWSSCVVISVLTLPSFSTLQERVPFVSTKFGTMVPIFVPVVDLWLKVDK